MFLIILTMIICYILGSVPTGYLVGKIFFKIDIRQQGSGNIGATNVIRTLGVIPGILVLIIDFVKGFICTQYVSILLISSLPCTDMVPGSQNIEVLSIICGICAIIGHNWTIFLNFKGGKGVATSMGVFLALTPFELGISAIVFLLVVLITRYVSLGSIISSVAFLVSILIFKKSLYIVLFGALATILIIIRHISNIKRILEGKENAIW
ncbi:MAG: glycerol-3-phosphate 1-O-acyltransferase PlsY [Candidatus Firestonebacteria bacterium]